MEKYRGLGKQQDQLLPENFDANLEFLGGVRIILVLVWVQFLRNGQMQ